MTARFAIVAILAAAVVAAAPHSDLLSAEALSPAPQSQVSATLQGSFKAARLAIPAFVTPAGDPELAAAAKTVAEVLWDDIDFESEFQLVSRDAASQIPAASTTDAIPFDRWAELGAGYVVFAKAQRESNGFSVALQLVSVSGADAKQVGFGKKYTPCTTRNPRTCAHFIADSLHREVAHLDGVAETKLAFTSDRGNQRMSGRPIENAGFAKEIYISDYDGANQQAITNNLSLNIAPAWSPDGRTLAYTSWVATFPDLYLRSIYETTAPARPAGGSDRVQNMLAAWSPDGTKIAFESSRNGSDDIWIMNRDGSSLRQITYGNKTNVSNTCPTWSPTGAQIAFTSDRTGSNQIYVMSADGTGVTLLTNDVLADRPTWSPAPYNDIAYTSTRKAGGHDVAIIDVATRQVRIMTDGTSDNEQPMFASTGRHIAFVTTRFGGKQQIAILDRKGNLQRQVTKDGDNTYPNWSRAAK